MKKRKKKYRLKKWVRVTLKILLFLLMIIIVFKVLIPKLKDNKIDNKLFDVSSLRYEYNNLDIIGKIEIKNIGIEAILTKTSDNDYYLEHDLNKNKNVAGNPYIDYRNNDDLAHERQINIYSHNVENKYYTKYYPFANLEKLLDKDTFDKNNEIIIYTDNRIFKYRIYAIKIISSAENEHMILETTNDLGWDYHTHKLLQDAKYCKDDCKIDSEDDLLILQTCYYTLDDAYILVIAKKI